MKILQATGAFYPAQAYGGTVAVSYQISKELVRRGHEVTVYTSDTLDKDHRQETKFSEFEGIKVYYFRNLSNRLAWHRLIFTPGMLPQLSKEIKNFNIIHLHGSRNFQNILVHHYAKKYSIPYVLQAHGSVLPIFQKQRLKNIFDLFFGYRILRDASKVIAVSKAEIEQYKQMGITEDKIVTVPNGINIKEFKNIPTPGKFRKKYNIKENHVILFLGRLHKRKGIDFLVKSFSELMKVMNDVALVIVGPDDGYKKEAEKLINALNLSNRIKLIGSIYGKDKLSAYVDADVLVYPAIYEIFGLVPFEAIMCGTPVIVTDDCGCGEFVKEANCGYLVKYGDTKELKEKMKRAIKNPEEGKEMVEKGKRYIEENLMWDKVVRQVEEVYENCICNI